LSFGLFFLTRSDSFFFFSVELRMRVVIDLTMGEEECVSRKRPREVGVLSSTTTTKKHPRTSEKEEDEEQDEALVQELLVALQRAAEEAYAERNGGGDCLVLSLALYDPELASAGGDWLLPNAEDILNDVDALCAW
jgi:hypothetical protein